MLVISVSHMLVSKYCQVRMFLVISAKCQYFHAKCRYFHAKCWYVK